MSYYNDGGGRGAGGNWGGGGGGGGGGYSRRPGDWECPSCGNNCFASRIECNRCQTPKPEGGGMSDGFDRGGGYHGSGSEYTGGGYGGGYGGGFGGGFGGGYRGGGGGYNRRPGDWDCPACGNHCFASRTECNRCQTKKPVTEGGIGGRDGYQGGGFYGGGGYGGGGYNKRPGDWDCPGCGYNCFASRIECNRCHTPKPAGAGGGGY